jgi:hypothetical protein
MRWKPVWQHVDQKAADELPGLQAHGLLLVVIPVVFPAESNPFAFDRHQAVVGDGSAVGVAPDGFVTATLSSMR